MTVRQAGAPVTDKELQAAMWINCSRQISEDYDWQGNKADIFKCHLLPRVAFFVDGFRKLTRLWQKGAMALLASALLAGCASADQPQEPQRDGPSLMMVPVNHYERYADPVFVDKYWAGNVGKRRPDGSPAGGGGAVCCYAGYKDWTKPIKVRWAWGLEMNRETEQIIRPDEWHEVMATLPGPPHQDTPDPRYADAYLCVILRDRDKVDLAYGTGSGMDCADMPARNRAGITCCHACRCGRCTRRHWRPGWRSTRWTECVLNPGWNFSYPRIPPSLPPTTTTWPACPPPRPTPAWKP
ncbi:hypothetical protein HNQ50_000470 [Silvimonas terrae]|uniref:DUF3304 domain-containing protein n=1 Tax=Silvimonas terrae TaxID=300266 RepID=A0A840RBN1_9NEIS|nr:hypothetical protein [Silvimonas terrae]